MWFTEAKNGFGLTVEITEHLCHRETPFQVIDIYETTKVGRMMTLDGIIQSTEFDEFAYQEMLAHLPLFAHMTPRKVLVIGGGDGGVLREIAKHELVESMDLCEIDEAVIECSQEFLPHLACGYNDPRVNVHIADGSKFIRQHPAAYDVIIVDSTDPGGPGEPLFDAPFYADLKRALRPGGIIATQSESIYLFPDIAGRISRFARANFRYSGYASILVPTYPTGMIGAAVACDIRDIRIPARPVPPDMKLRYYNSAIHTGSFALPTFAESFIEEG